MTALSINNTAGQAAALRSLSTLNRTIPSTETRLSTGLRLSSPRDDGAAFAVSIGLRNTIKAAQGVREGLDVGRGVLGVALAGATQIGDTLKELRQLALSASGTSNQQQIQSLAKQFNEGVAFIGALVEQASFRGVNLLDGSRNSMSIAAGIGDGNVNLAGFNFDGIKTLLETDNIGATVPPAPTPGKYDELINRITARIKATTGQTNETNIREFANRFISQIGRDNELQVYALGQLLINSLGGTAASDEHNRQLTGNAVELIGSGNDVLANELIGTLIERLPASPPPPPPPAQTATLRVEFLSESAGYQNVFGYYNRETGAGGILFPNVEAEGTNAPLVPGQSTADFTVKAEDVGKIEYFLISDGARLNSPQELSGGIKVVQAADGSFGIARVDTNGNLILDAQGSADFLEGRDARALFTETSKNAGGVDYASSIPGPTQTASTLAGDSLDGPTGIIAFEDIAAARHGNNGSYAAPGDADYNDAVFNVTRLTPPPPPPPRTTLRATFLSEEAGYRNVFGYYNRRTGEAQVLFGNVEADGTNPPLRSGQSSVEFTVNSADVNDIDYFLISDGATLNSSSELEGNLKVLRAADGTYGIARVDADGNVIQDAQGNAAFLQGQGARALFTETSKNAGGVDYASGTAGPKQNRRTLSSDTRDGPTGTVAFEDLAATRQSNGRYRPPGDADYNDAVFNIVIVGSTGGSSGTGGTGDTGGSGETGGTGGTSGTGGTVGTGGTGGTGGSGDPGDTSSTVTLGRVFSSVDQAIAQIELGTAALEASLQQIDKYDTFVEELSKIADATLGALVKTDLQKDSAILVAQRIQKDLGTETIGITSKAASGAVQALFREPQIQAAEERNETSEQSLKRSAILRVEPPPDEKGSDKLQRSAILHRETPEESERQANKTLRRPAVVRIGGGAANGARLDISA